MLRRAGLFLAPGRRPIPPISTSMSNRTKRPQLSIAIPAHNEEEVIGDVLREVRDVMDASPIEHWECVIVDDGSTDDTVGAIQAAVGGDARFRLIKFVRNAGQSAAMEAGMKASRGKYIGAMDADGQNDPRDFPRLLKALKSQGVDVMGGVRAKRRDNFVRKVSSRLANGVRNWATRETVTDVGCSIRVMRRECVERLRLYHGLHRFLPTLLRMEGFTIGEIPVNHRPRGAGESKYGINNRLWKGIRDIFAVRWMQKNIRLYETEEISLAGKEPPGE